MHQIKLFCDIESNVENLENRINSWLDENGVHIVSVVGNIAPQTGTKDATATRGIAGQKYASSDLFVAIVYEKH